MIWFRFPAAEDKKREVIEQDQHTGVGDQQVSQLSQTAARHMQSVSV